MFFIYIVLILAFNNFNTYSIKNFNLLNTQFKKIKNENNSYWFSRMREALSPTPEPLPTPSNIIVS